MSKRPLKSVVAGKSPNQGTKKTAQKALSQAKSPNQDTNKCLKRPNQRHQQKDLYRHISSRNPKSAESQNRQRASKI